MIQEKPERRAESLLFTLRHTGISFCFDPEKSDPLARSTYKPPIPYSRLLLSCNFSDRGESTRRHSLITGGLRWRKGNAATSSRSPRQLRIT